MGENTNIKALLNAVKEFGLQVNMEKSTLLVRRKALTLAVWADNVGGTHGPCQKCKVLTLHNFFLCSPI
jgi:hypothetical protein